MPNTLLDSQIYIYHHKVEVEKKTIIKGKYLVIMFILKRCRHRRLSTSY